MNLPWNERKQLICKIDIMDGRSSIPEMPREEWSIQDFPTEKRPHEKELLQSPCLSPVLPFISSELTGSYIEDGQGHQVSFEAEEGDSKNEDQLCDK